MNIPDDIALAALSVSELQALLGRVERVLGRRHVQMHKTAGLVRSLRTARGASDPISRARCNAARVRRFMK